ncbi:MAG: hypothetical protein LBE44_03520 [Microbacterium hominis]|nr:hypothetical protein [Microbacterium hominis]
MYSRGDRIRLLGPELTSKNSAVGIICTRTNVHQIAREAIDNATYVCEEHYGLFKGPPVQLICPKDLNFMYVPSHLVRPSALFLVIRFSSHRLTLLANAIQNHVLFEVLKNSLRAVVETHGVDCENYPPVKVIVAEGSEVRHFRVICFRVRGTD